MKNYAKMLSMIDLNAQSEVTLLRDISDFDTEMDKRIRQINKEKKMQQEELIQISNSCIRNNESEKITSNITSKVILVMITSLITYYGIFALSYTYLINLVSPLVFDIILVGLMLGFFIFFMCGIYYKNFGRTQVSIYFLLYSVTSSFGVILAIITLYPITSYQIINTYIYIMIIQLIIFMISVSITRKLICRSSIETNNTTIQF